MLKCILIVVFILSSFNKLFANGPTCEQSLEKLLRSVEVPRELVKLDIEKPLNYDIEAFEKWIFEVKGKVINSMLNKDGSFASHLLKHQDMDINERKVLAYSVEVRPFSKNSNLYIALFWSDDNLNRSQMRTELFEYGGGDAVAGEIPSEKSLFLHESCEACRGLNLKGESFFRFERKLNQSGKSFYPEEKAFFENILNPLKKIHPDGNFNIISLFAKGASLDTLVHEGHHALFDTNKTYKKALLDYWDTHIRNIQDDEISSSFRIPYSTYELLQDEFYAYLLQPKVFGQANPMEKFKEQHLERVIDILKEAGTPPPFY